MTNITKVELPLEPRGLGWFTNTSNPRADIVDWCRSRPGLVIEPGPPRPTCETYPIKRMKQLGIVGLYVTAWPDR